MGMTWVRRYRHQVESPGRCARPATRRREGHQVGDRCGQSVPTSRHLVGSGGVDRLQRGAVEALASPQHLDVLAQTSSLGAVCRLVRRELRRWCSAATFHSSDSFRVGARPVSGGIHPKSRGFAGIVGTRQRHRPRQRRAQRSPSPVAAPPVAACHGGLPTVCEEVTRREMVRERPGETS